METETLRKFIPGNKWMYFKIYTGVKTADYILEEAIKPLTEYLLQKKVISKWFFIRYHDPEAHIRFRLQLNNTKSYGEVLEELNKSLMDYTESGEVSNILIDTYSREIERYGKFTIEDAEDLFFLNSNLILDCLYLDDEEKILLSLFHIDTILEKLGLSIKEKVEWIKDFNYSFKREFNANKSLNSQLDKKYREIKFKLPDFKHSEKYLEIRNLIIYNTDDSSIILQNIIQYYKNDSLEIDLQNFFQSIFHMNINRLFVSNQRLFEMVIYDYLNRYYKSIFFINNRG